MISSDRVSRWCIDMPKEIKLYKKDFREFRFDVVADNRAILASSEVFSCKSKAMDAIKFMKENVEDECLYEIFMESNGKYYFSMVCEGKELILCSQGYSSNDAAAEGVRIFKKTAHAAEIVEVRQKVK